MKNNISLAVFETNTTVYQYDTINRSHRIISSNEEMAASTIDGAILTASGTFLLVVTIVSTFVCTFVLWSLARRGQLTKATYRLVAYLMVIELMVR